jgi:hypothetical protein
LISISHIIKKVQLKKKKREKSQRKKRQKIMSGEKCEREEKMDKCSTGQKNHPLRKKA